MREYVILLALEVYGFTPKFAPQIPKHIGGLKCPYRDCGQASVVCISHRVLFFRIRKDSLNRFFALCINLFRTLRLPYLLYYIQILLPNVGCVYLLSLFVCSALCFTRTIDAFFWCASVGSLTVPVCGCMP